MWEIVQGTLGYPGTLVGNIAGIGTLRLLSLIYYYYYYYYIVRRVPGYPACQKNAQNLRFYAKYRDFELVPLSWYPCWYPCRQVAKGTPKLTS